MELQIGSIILGRGTRERAELRGRHGERPTPPDSIFQRDTGPLEERAVVHVHGPRALYSEDATQLQMILQVFANSRQMLKEGYAECGEPSGIADAGAFENCRTDDGPCAKDHFALR